LRAPPPAVTIDAMECPAYGSPVEPGQPTCQTCGAQIAGEESGHSAANIDPPTEVLPSVASSGAADEFDAKTSSDLPTTAIELPPAVDRLPAGPAVIERSADGRSSSVAWRQLVVGALVGGAVVLAFVVGAWAVSGGFAGLFGAQPPGSPASAAGSGEPSAPPSTQQTPGAEAEGFGCTPRQLTAPGGGRWRLYRAEWGSRGNFDYLRLKLRHEGRHEEAATASVEVLAPADVSGRYGIEAPAEAEVALVVAFNGPVGIGAPWGGRGGGGALREFRIARGLEGRVHAVVGVRGQGCFRLSAGGWEAGEMKPTDITLEIQKP
jgi:hypothetical protein